ncbi:MAG: transposase [Gammaproteobacteria bacterium]
MTNYRRIQTPGGTYFFTVNLARRRNTTLLVEQIDVLRNAFRTVKTSHPFHIDAIVILPDHLHAIWTLPADDGDYAKRWSLIKSGFSRSIPQGEYRSKSRMKRRERGIWQRRFWEHRIRDHEDMRKHIDYIHWNPVKHGYVTHVQDWPHSSFHAYVDRGLLPQDWAGGDGGLDLTGE